MGFLSRFFVPHSGEEAEEEEEEKKEEERRRKKRKKRWRRRRKVDTKHNFTTLFSPTWTAASPAQILSFTFQINMKNFTFLNLPRKSVDEQCSGVEWGLCIESNRVATQTVKYHPNLQNRTWTHKSVQTHTPQNRDIPILCKTYHLHMALRGEQGGGWHKNECRHEGGHENKYWEENEQLRNPTRPTPQLGTPQIWREKQNTLNSLFKVYNSYLMKVNLQLFVAKWVFKRKMVWKVNLFRNVLYICALFNIAKFCSIFYSSLF